MRDIDWSVVLQSLIEATRDTSDTTVSAVLMKLAVAIQKGLQEAVMQRLEESTQRDTSKRSVLMQKAKLIGPNGIVRGKLDVGVEIGAVVWGGGVFVLDWIKSQEEGELIYTLVNSLHKDADLEQ